MRDLILTLRSRRESRADGRQLRGGFRSRLMPPTASTLLLTVAMELEWTFVSESIMSPGF